MILGGPHATMLARPILERYNTFDVVVRHKAENTIGPVLSRLDSREFSDIPGITWRTQRGIAESAGSPRVGDLDSLPWLDYDLYPAHADDSSFLAALAANGVPMIGPSGNLVAGGYRVCD